MILAVACVTWADLRQARHILHVSDLTGSRPPAASGSPTGYADGSRHQLVPEHNTGSLQWIMQTQQQLSQRTWHVRHVDYDNAPFGREVRGSSAYRWWLAAVATIDQWISGRPAGQAVERAALLADPLWHLLLLVTATGFVARFFGGFPAAATALALALLFPWAGSFVAGEPDDRGLQLGCALWAVLPLAAAFRPGLRGSRGEIACFALAGLASGLGLWVDVATTGPLLAGLIGGALLAAWVGRTDGAEKPPAPTRWRIWALAGAVTCLVTYAVDIAGSGAAMGSLATVHPLFGLAWLGAGEWLTWAAERAAGIRRKPGRAGKLVMTLAALAVAAVPALLWWQWRHGLPAWHPLADRLSGLPGSPVAAGTAAWVVRDGFGAALGATLLPLGWVGLAGWLWGRGDRAWRPALSLVALPLAVALGFAWNVLRGWAGVDAMLLGLLPVVLAAARGRALLRWSAVAIAAAAVACAWPWVGIRAPGGDDQGVTRTEAETLIERDLAQWLAGRTGPVHAVVLAPPDLAAALCYYGGHRALSTPYRENMDGFGAAVRIAGATLPDEAYALVRRREVTHILVPSWDAFLDQYARLGANDVDKSFMSLLHTWLPPRWLRPVPYQMPAVAGLEGRSLAIFEVVEMQDDATALAHLGEYFVEMGDLDQAGRVGDALAHWFPEDARAFLARSVIDRARGNSAGFQEMVGALLARVPRERERDLTWEARVILATVLAEARQGARARELLRACLAEADAPRLRALTTGTLYRLQALALAWELPLPDRPTQALALELLPPELREQLLARAGKPDGR